MHPISPLDELLEDLSSQAVTDLLYVWLQRDRKKQQPQGRFHSLDLHMYVNIASV